MPGDILNVLGPFGMVGHRIDAEPEDLDVAPVEFAFKPRHRAKFGGADRREILRVRKQDAPRGAEPVVKADAAFGGLRLEVRGRIVQLQCHVRLLAAECG